MPTSVPLEVIECTFHWLLQFQHHDIRREPPRPPVRQGASERFCQMSSRYIQQLMTMTGFNKEISRSIQLEHKHENYTNICGLGSLHHLQSSGHLRTLFRRAQPGS